MTTTITLRNIAVLLAATSLAAACATDVGADSSSGGDGSGGSGGGVGLGGAQDIGAFRALLDAGEIPGERTLDANGFFSEHYSELPPSDCGQPLCLVGMMAVGREWVHAVDRAVLQVSLSTPLDPSELERKPLNLVVVVDVSGSMNEENRIGFAREGLHTLIDELEEGDRLALVTFNQDVTVRATLVEPSDRDALHAIADDLVADGSTNLHDGLERGFQLGLDGFDPDRQNRILLVSDGLATAGITDDAAIEAMADRYLSDGIGLTTIGVGLDFNVELMRRLAERGAGSFYFLEDASAIAEVFREELDTFVTPLALDVELDVAAESGWRIGEVVGTHFWTGSERSGGVALPAVFLASRKSDQPGELGRRGAGGAIFVSMLPADGRSVWAPSDAVAALRLRYRLPDTGERLETSLTVESRPDPGASPAAVYLSNEAMAEHYAMYSMFLGLREASQSAAYLGYDCALAVLARLDESAASWQREFADEDIAADRELVARFQANLRERGATAAAGDLDVVCADDGDLGYGDDVVEDDVYPYCQAGGGGGAGALSWALIGLALIAVRRRRGAGEPLRGPRRRTLRGAARGIAWGGRGPAHRAR
ncbi:MAG TPA: VWA domain-containing protein [Candidatus Acidoferrum sp.]|nr:VWA domain-containing protein [Candidatus Acidoferrum sp.]